ncbi:MAG: hypothetical protein QGG74_01745, partial [Phycisphaerales bacterium]|nr:hypothetical protein [Phycisphaerales bacterium]
MSLTRVVPRVWLIVGVLLAVLGVTQTGVAADSTYTVNRFEVAWKRVSADLPPSGDLQQAEVTLGRTPRGYTGKVRGKPAVRTDVAALGRQGVVRVDAKALDAIAAAIQKKVEAGGLLGVTVQAFLEQTSKGKTPRYTAWFLAEAPLPDLVANTRIPLDLTDLNEQAVPAPLAVVPDAPIPIESSSAPSPTTVPLAAESPVVAEAPVDVKDAVEPAVARVTPTIDAPPVIEDPVETVASAPSVETEVVVESTAAETHAATERPVETVPTTVAPAAATAAAPPAVKPKPHKPSRRPPPVIEGVSVRWAGGSDVRGDPATLFRLTTLRLRVVDGEMQAGWGDVGIVTSMYGDLLFPQEAWRRPWLPSATREVLHAIVDRLKELGMDGTRVTKAFETEDGHSKLVFTLHPPPRGADLPPLVTQNETVDGNFYYAVWPFDVMYSLDHSELPPASSFEHLPI